MANIDARPGRIRPAPENFLTHEQIAAVKEGRRDFLRTAFVAASAAMAAPAVVQAAVQGEWPEVRAHLLHLLELHPLAT